MILLFVYKKLTFEDNYPVGYCALDVILLIIFFIIMLFHLKLAAKGNKIEKVFTLGFGFLFELLNLIGFIYFALIQTYITYFDFWLSIIGLIFNVLAIFFTIFALFSIAGNVQMK